MKQEVKTYICKYCGDEYIGTRGGFSNHLRYCKMNPKSVLNRKHTSNKSKEYFNKLKNIDELTKKTYTFICKNCNQHYELVLTLNEYNKHKYSDFCCIKCSKQYATKNIDKTTKKEAKCIDCGKIIYISKTASISKCRCKDCKLNLLPTHICIVCGKEFKHKKAKCCSNKCFNEYIKNRKLYLSKETLNKFVENGKKSANKQKEIRRSKNEIEFFNLCKQYFSNVTNNESIFNGWDADIIIHDIKYAILWNGKWHYEKICKNHSIKQVQNRDNIKISEIIKYGYIPYIIKDMGKYNKKFVNEKFNEFLIYLKENGGMAQ